MDYGMILGILHQFVGLLLYPVVLALALALLAVLLELGYAIYECWFTLKSVVESSTINVASAERYFQAYANKRLERADLLARAGPILGLMGTLIPLGPGLTALGTGNIDILATALTIAFDTTVVGLLIGLVAFILGKIRRRWYDQTWQALQSLMAGNQETEFVHIHTVQNPQNKSA